MSCNTSFIHQETRAPAGRSDRASSFFRDTGLTEDRFDPAFRGRLGIPNALIARLRPAKVSKRTPIIYTPNKTSESGPHHVPRLASYRDRGHHMIKKNETDDALLEGSTYFQCAPPTEFKTSNSEYGSTCESRHEIRAGLSSYVGSICKEVTLERLFH